MKTTRATLHMCLAAYMADDPDKQIKAIARKVKRTSISKRTQRTMGTVLECARPAELVKRVWWESDHPHPSQ